MKHDPFLANDLTFRSLLAKIEKLTARVAVLERRLPRPKAKRRKSQPAQPERDAAAFAALTAICSPIAAAHGIDLHDLRGRDIAEPRSTARRLAAQACRDAGFTTSVIGRYFDGRDHSVVLYLIRGRKDRK